MHHIAPEMPGFKSQHKNTDMPQQVDASTFTGESCSHLQEDLVWKQLLPPHSGLPCAL